MANNHKELKVWVKSYNLAKDVYSVTRNLPKSEIYGLASQMQRSAVSIASNIAEGHQRNGVNEFRQFLGIAKGSSAELETQLMLARDIYGIDVSKQLKDIDEIQRMIQVLSSKL